MGCYRNVLQFSSHARGKICRNDVLALARGIAIFVVIPLVCRRTYFNDRMGLQFLRRMQHPHGYFFPRNEGLDEAITELQAVA